MNDVVSSPLNCVHSRRHPAACVLVQGTQGIDCIVQDGRNKSTKVCKHCVFGSVFSGLYFLFVGRIVLHLKMGFLSPRLK
jgi:hypothetical protein